MDTTKKIIISSNLVKNKGTYYAMFSWYGTNSKRKQSMRSLGIKAISGNKNKAKKKLKEAERQFEDELNAKVNTTTDYIGADILFTDYLKEWIKIVKPTLELSTYGEYGRTVELICSYFEPLHLSLCNLKRADIQKYYDYIRTTRNIKNNTIRHYHAVIHKALEDAVERELLDKNVARNIKFTKKEQYISSYYNKKELEKLFEVAKGDLIELHILLAAFYGLRREEVIGLTYENINLIDKTITVRRTVTNANVNGKSFIVEKDRTKNKSSNRTLPLIPFIEKLLIEERDKQAKNRKIFGNTYKNKNGYVLVDEEGKLIKPDRVTRRFAELLKKNNLKKIRFHDLRHSCASLLLANGINYKEIQQWLGHSSASTTMNIYSHIDSSAKINSANVLANVFEIGT